MVALDLKFLEGKIILHLIDTFTRYSQAAIINSKHATTVIDTIFKIWITYFGRPGTLFSDNGPEFNNVEYLELCAKYEINAKVTPVEAPFSNGISERHNSVIEQMTKRTKQSTGCSWSTALMWAVNAKNNLHNIYGFSPQQLVMGTNCVLPSILDTNNLATLNETTVSRLVADNLNAMQKAREEFMKAERNVRLKRALKSRVPSYNDDALLNGDIVYYKRLKGKDYQGPCTVVGVIDKNVIIKHGGKLIRLHPSKVLLKNKGEDLLQQGSKSLTTDKKVETDEENEEESDTSDESDEEFESCDKLSGLDTHSEEDVNNQNNDEAETEVIKEPEIVVISEEEEQIGEIDGTKNSEVELCIEPTSIMGVHTEQLWRNTPITKTTTTRTYPNIPAARGLFDDWSMSAVNISSTPARTDFIPNLRIHPAPLATSSIRNNQPPEILTELAMSEKLKCVFPIMKSGDKIKIKEFGNDWLTVQLTSRGGKSSGINQYHWNGVDIEKDAELGVHFYRL